MDQEMLSKINGVLKANGKRELSPDELEKIVGGGKGDPGPDKVSEHNIDYQEGVKCPVCGGTNTISINGNCICSDCLPHISPADADCIPLIIP